MNVSIISVGTELLIGKTINTNVAYLSQQLNLLGHDVLFHHTVGDNKMRMQQIMEYALSQCEVIITTGGLGPTRDDLTKEIACQVMGCDLLENHEAMQTLEERFVLMGRPMTENNRKQAYFPKEAIILPNRQGTAPGMAIEKDNKCIICLPGPPREMQVMYEEAVFPLLEQKSQAVLYYRDIRTYGIGESFLETALVDLIDGQKDPTLATYAGEGECYLRIASKKRSVNEAEATVEAMIKVVEERIGRYIYSTRGETLAQVVGTTLINKGITISVAESCTGGLFASMLIDVPGISAVFDRGMVTYSNRAKVHELGVSGESLKKFGAVSPQVAKEMAVGLAKTTDSDVCVSSTGIAGPTGGVEGKPVGLTYIGIYFKGDISVKEIRMRNVNRKWNRNYATLAMLDEVYRKIK